MIVPGFRIVMANLRQGCRQDPMLLVIVPDSLNLPSRAFSDMLDQVDQPLSSENWY